MKQISAILIAFFLCVSTTQVCAQQADIRVMKIVTAPEPYEFGPTDNTVVFTSLSVSSICKLPPPADNAGRVLHIINRRGSTLTVSHSTLTSSLAVPYKNAVEVMCDGIHWFVKSKSAGF
jgi:hypothetical protein